MNLLGVESLLQMRTIPWVSDKAVWEMKNKAVLRKWEYKMHCLEPDIFYWGLYLLPYIYWKKTCWSLCIDSAWRTYRRKSLSGVYSGSVLKEWLNGEVNRKKMNVVDWENYVIYLGQTYFKLQTLTKELISEKIRVHWWWGIATVMHGYLNMY